MNIKGGVVTNTARLSNRPLLSKEKSSSIKVFATSVIRCTKDSELTGFLFEIDWLENRIKKKIPIPLNTTHPFWNSRGGNRGGRGVVYHKGVLYVATAMSILMFDDSLHKIGELSHPHFGGLHEIFIDDEGIWVTSTLHDLIIKIDFNGSTIEEWFACDSEILQKEFNFPRRKLNLNLDFPADNFVNHYENYCKEEIFHLNSIYPHNNSLYFLSYRLNAFIRFKPEAKVILIDKELGAPHNGMISPNNQVIINDTKNQCLRVYDLETGKRLQSLVTAVYGTRENSVQFASSGWQRGLFPVDDSIYLVGTSPATIFEVDLKKAVIGQVCQLDSDVRHCIHGLTVARGF